MFSLHICHKCIELLSLIESDSLLTLIYVLVDNVSCYEYPAGIEHSVRVKNTANYFYSLSHTGSYSGNCVTLREDLLCFHSCSLWRGSSGGLQSGRHKWQPWGSSVTAPNSSGWEQAAPCVSLVMKGSLFGWLYPWLLEQCQKVGWLSQDLIPWCSWGEGAKEWLDSRCPVTYNWGEKAVTGFVLLVISRAVS